MCDEDEWNRVCLSPLQGTAPKTDHSLKIGQYANKISSYDISFIQYLSDYYAKHCAKN